ncbi:MAG: hypothetical protein U0R49_09760 [Fimbriimonadales bacterium]
MKTVLGIDPGSAKVGVAVVRSENGATKIVRRAVIELPKFLEAVQEIAGEQDLSFAVIGNGTNSKSIQGLLRESLPGLSLLIIDERDTSIRARERYWIENPRRGWRRLLPSSLQVPPEPVDDFVAVILAEAALSVD